MQKVMKLTYHYHSGFSVRIGATLLIFDYWEGEKSQMPESGKITAQMLAAFEKIYVFVSHGHPDHFERDLIYSWQDAGLPVTYICSKDMPVGCRGKRMGPLDTLKLSQDIFVQAYDSTDLGVSYLVKAYGMNIFHAGDLNLWHWRQESTLREIEAAENAFYQALEPLTGERIDVAMFPVDPRQGAMYDAGANHFILSQKPRVFIPMHWQDRVEVAIDFSRRAKNPLTEVLAMTRPGEMAIITFHTEKNVDVHIIEPPKDIRQFPVPPVRKAKRAPESFDGNDPFEDTDLPVDLL